MPQIQRRHVQREDVQDEDYFLLRQPEGKNTTSGDGKACDVYLLTDAEGLSHRYADQDDSRTNLFINLTSSVETLAGTCVWIWEEG